MSPQETPTSIQAWLDEVRKSLNIQARHNVGQVMERAEEEWAEYLKAQEPADAVGELADVAIVLMSSPDIMAAVDKKMTINRKRTWRADGRGMIYHEAEAQSESGRTITYMENGEPVQLNIPGEVQP